MVESPRAQLEVTSFGHVSVSVQLQREKEHLESRLKQVNKTIELLNRNPEVKEIVNGLRMLGI